MAVVVENAPHVFILDINGEYDRAFPSKKLDEQGQQTKLPDQIYLNGEKFGIPLWFFNSQEICTWLSASEQTQEPVLKDWWAVAKAKNYTSCSDKSSDKLINTLHEALRCLNVLLDELPKIKKKAVCSYRDAIIGYLKKTDIDTKDFQETFSKHKGIEKFDINSVDNQAEIREEANHLETKINDVISSINESPIENTSTTDSPLLVKKKDLSVPELIKRTISQPDSKQIDSHLTTLRLRLKTRLDDKRWRAFLNYEKNDTKFSNLADWLKRFGFQDCSPARISVIDLSMLSHEALPYACAVIGRILLETRERLPADERYKNPWVLVLEEAHNYVRPAKQSEERGQELSRNAFERVAKEGRKFGLSLIVASQRPSEISPTIISQCANFISHRLQNPDDIDHFRRIIPMQARRLLDQVTVLDSGEAIVFGSAFHIPTRVQIDKPFPEPWSQTAAPYYEWKKIYDSFPIDKIMENWGA